jgi:hypothetical protein
MLRGYLPFLAFLLLFGATAAILVSEERIRRRQQAHAEEFQRLVGGVGFGPATDLSGCVFSFDPRLDGSRSLDYGPIPGGSCFYPQHASSVFFYRPLVRETALPEEGDGNVPLP